MAELKAYPPFNGYNNCKSFARNPAYLIGRDDDGRNLMTMSKNELFTITEIEVWQITYQ
jgi:hypothetical protein